MNFLWSHFDHIRSRHHSLTLAQTTQTALCSRSPPVMVPRNQNQLVEGEVWELSGCNRKRMNDSNHFFFFKNQNEQKQQQFTTLKR